MELIDKSALVAEIEKRLKKHKEEIEKYSPFQHNLVYDIIGKKEECSDILSFLDTLEVKDINSVWHNIDDIPNFNTNGVSDLIIDSYYGHIYREAHYYTPEKWDTHIGFNTNRQFRWAYEKDLIEVQEGEDI